jgi:hypothetical protein
MLMHEDFGMNSYSVDSDEAVDEAKKRSNEAR